MVEKGGFRPTDLEKFGPLISTIHGKVHAK